MTMISERYNIDHKLKGQPAEGNQGWRTLETLPQHWSLNDVIHRYKRLRNENLEVALRLVRVTHTEDLCGKGEI